MKYATFLTRLSSVALAVGSLGTAAAADAQSSPSTTTTPTTGTSTGEPAENKRTVSFIDLAASVGYASNPLLRLNGHSSASGRISISGFHSWNSETGTTYVSGYLEDTTYLSGGYGSKVIFRVNGHTNQALSEKVTVFADVAASGDVAGQLGNRFTQPIPVPPPAGGPPPVQNPNLFNLSGRQYLVSAQTGASIVTSTRSNISLSAGAQHGFFTGSNHNADYTTYQGSLGYNHQLSERTWGGVSVAVQHQDFKGGDYANIVNTAFNVRTLLASDINANASIGVLAVYDHRAAGNSHSYSPSFRGSVCKTGQYTSFCAAVSRDAQAPLGIGVAQGARSATINTTVDVTWRRRIGPTETIGLSLNGTRNSNAAAVNGQRFYSTFITGLAGYDRRIGNRLYAGVSGGARKLYQTGPDPKWDVNGSVYLRYRLGDII
jgi:hypothetical protein